MKSLFILPLLLTFSLSFASEQIAPAENLDAFEPEDEYLITDRDRGSREKPNLYYYNRQNVQYNRRYQNDRNDYYQNDSNYYNSPASMDTFNRSYYQDNTSPDLYLNR